MNLNFAKAIACIEREIRFRRRVYPRLVELKKMTGDTAQDEISAMESIRDYLRDQEPNLFNQGPKQ